MVWPSPARLESESAGTQPTLPAASQPGRHRAGASGPGNKLHPHPLSPRALCSCAWGGAQRPPARQTQSQQGENTRKLSFGHAPPPAHALPLALGPSPASGFSAEPPRLQGANQLALFALHIARGLRAATSRSEVRQSGATWTMVQLRPRASRTPASASAMVDEDQSPSEEEAEHGLLLGQPSSGAAAEPLEEDEEGDDEFDDEAPEELTFASAQAEAREEERRVRETVRRFGAYGRAGEPSPPVPAGLSPR